MPIASIIQHYFLISIILVEKIGHSYLRWQHATGVRTCRHFECVAFQTHRDVSKNNHAHQIKKQQLSNNKQLNLQIAD